MSINDPQLNISVKITFYFNILEQSILDFFWELPIYGPSSGMIWWFWKYRYYHNIDIGCKKYRYYGYRIFCKNNITTTNGSCNREVRLRGYEVTISQIFRNIDRKMKIIFTPEKWWKFFVITENGFDLNNRKPASNSQKTIIQKIAGFSISDEKPFPQIRSLLIGYRMLRCMPI